MSLPALQLSVPKTPIPACSPNLMPFHIAHTGPAPVSTYFRPKMAPSPQYGSGTPAADTPAVSDSQATLVDLEGSTSQLSLASTSMATADVEMTADSDRSSASEHLVAAFRGRTMRGRTVSLPFGYAGIVLNAPEAKQQQSASASRSSGAHKPSSSTRATRGSKQKMVESDADPDLTDLADALEPSLPVRKLNASATFSSFVLWNADIPVDEGKDEYLRTLSEWTSLAAVIHSHEDKDE